MKKAAYDVVIVGAGIVGAACADEFAHRGRRVVVIGADIIGGGATAAGIGHIVVMDDSDAQFALTRYSQQLWQELRPELPDDVEYEQCGTIWVAADEEEMIEVRSKRDYYDKRGVPTEVLDAKALLGLEPNLRCRQQEFPPFAKDAKDGAPTVCWRRRLQSAPAFDCAQGMLSPRW